MDAIILAVIIFVAIAGPSILALVLYWRNNPDRRRSWRRAAEDAPDTPPAHDRRGRWGGWVFCGRGGVGGVEGGGRAGGAAGATGAGAAGATAEVAVPAKSQLGEGFEPCLMLCRHPTLWRWIPRDLRLSHTG